VSSRRKRVAALPAASALPWVSGFDAVEANLGARDPERIGNRFARLGDAAGENDKTGEERLSHGREVSIVGGSGDFEPNLCSGSRSLESMVERRCQGE
jgi:hypothetical protein